MKARYFDIVLLNIMLLAALTVSVYGSVYNLYYVQASPLSCETPKVVLQPGNAGTSTVYMNSTSAKVNVAAAGEPTYYPNGYSISTGTYISGNVPTSVQAVDTNYFIVRSSAASTAYNPSGYGLLGNTTLVSGSTTDLVSNDSIYMTFRSYASATSAQTLYAHQEMFTFFHYLKLSSADTAGETHSADASTTGRKIMGYWLYQLTGVTSIPASIWTFYYRASQSHSAIVAHCDVDILVITSGGAIRSTIATNVANSEPLSTSWSTVLGTYSWAAYPVVNQTDYLAINYYITVETKRNNEYVYLRIDDNTLALADQTRVDNIFLPSQFTSEVEFTGSSNTGNWSQLVWSIDSSWTIGSVTVTIQVYNYTGLGQYPTSGNGYDSYTSSSTAYVDETRTQTITINPTHFRNGSGYWKIKVKGVKTTTAQFDFKADWIEFGSIYSQYTVSTQFLFSGMTTNTPTQLNFTVVSQYNTTGVNVEIQVWNYSSNKYVTTGEGYTTYMSSEVNETKLLSINTNPQFFTSGGGAKINVTGTLETSAIYQQEINQVKLLYKYGSSTYDYVLKINNTVTNAWKINLKAYSSSNVSRLSSATIRFHDGTTSDQIIISGGIITQSEGPQYDLPENVTRYISIVNINASTGGTSYLYVYLKILVPSATVYSLFIITFEIT